MTRGIFGGTRWLAALAAMACIGAGAWFILSGSRCRTICNEARKAGVADVLRYGRGAAFFDANNDGWEEIWAADAATHVVPNYGVSRLYRNATGTFISIDPRTIGFNDDDLTYQWAVATADYDRDGDQDILLGSGAFSGDGSLSLYRNVSSSTLFFENVSRASGITDAARGWWGVSWADYDRDGFADFAATETNGRVRIYHNERGRTFTEEAARLGIGVTLVDGKNPVWLDYDNDSYPDLYIACFACKPRLYHNERGISFREISDYVPATDTKQASVMYNPVFAAGAADFNQDGWIDLYLGRQSLGDQILINERGTFVPYGSYIGINTKTFPDITENTMGLGIGDFNSDGFPDSFIGTGGPSGSYVDIVFCGEGADATDGPGFRMRRCGDFALQHGKTQTHGIILGDVDHSGSTDIFYNIGGSTKYDYEHAGKIDSKGYSALYMQEKRNLRGAEVRLIGTKSNPDGFGARIEVQGSRKHFYTMLSAQGFQSQNSAWMSVSFDTATATARIMWPSGKEQQVELTLGERRTITEPH